MTAQDQRIFLFLMVLIVVIWMAVLIDYTREMMTPYNQCLNRCLPYHTNTVDDFVRCKNICKQ